MTVVAALSHVARVRPSPPGGDSSSRRGGGWLHERRFSNQTVETATAGYFKRHFFGKRTLSSIDNDEDDLEEEEANKKQGRSKKRRRKDGHSGLAEADGSRNRASSGKTMSVIRILQTAWQRVRVSCVLLAINVVLTLRLESPLLRTMPSSMLVYLMETCLMSHARPKLVRIVAMELDDRVRSHISRYTAGQDSYQLDDLAKAAIASYTNKEKYEFGDITKATVAKLTAAAGSRGQGSRSVLHRFIGKDEYKFGDLSRTVAAKLSGQESYKFGDVTRRALAQLQRDSSSSGMEAYRNEVRDQVEIAKKQQSIHRQRLRREHGRQRLRKWWHSVAGFFRKARTTSRPAS